MNEWTVAEDVANLKGKLQRLLERLEGVTEWREGERSYAESIANEYTQKTIQLIKIQTGANI